MFEYIEKVALIRKARHLFGSEWYAERVVSLVESQPVVDVAPVRRGHWIKCGYACGEAEFECSHCHEIEWRANETDYCPNCGARMEVPNDD